MKAKKKKVWTIEQVEESLKINVKDYGSAIAVAGLFKKIYGVYPKIGLSGCQAQYANLFCEKLPEPKEL